MTTFIRTTRLVRTTLALALALGAAAPASLALACGPYTDVPPVAASATAATPTHVRERATGAWPQVAHSGGNTTLELVYPHFAQSGDQLYLHTFRVVRDAQLAAMERAERRHGRWPLSVTVEQVGPSLWRVVSFRVDAR